MRYLAPTIALVASLASSCASPSRGRGWLEDSVRARSHHALGPRSLADVSPLPPGSDLSDGLGPDEAVAIALWRSPALQAELTKLDSSLADFDEATSLPNPTLSLLAPVGPRQLATLLAWPIDALWQLPSRTRAAQRTLQRVAASLVQTVLDTQRDVRLAHSDAYLARSATDARIALAAAWGEASELAASRARAGDIAPVDALAVSAEAAIAADAVARARAEASIANARLMAALGAPWQQLPALTPAPALPAPSAEPAAAQQLVARAYRNRPDLRAAELAIHASAALHDWERARVVSLVASLDGKANPGEWKPHFAPGLQVVLPVFARNPGGIGRAEAEIARAGHLYAATRLRVALEVRSALAMSVRARASLAAYATVVERLADASTQARHAFEGGAESYLFVVDAQRREADARLRRIELEAELARAEAELARALGGTTTEEP